jgi:ribosomal protein S27E
MHPSHDNDNERERPVFGRFSLAKGLLCPDCNREIQCEDLRFSKFDFWIICGGCGFVLLSVED